MKSKVWSNFFFIIPLVIALYNQLFLYSFLILSVMVFSSIYHYSEEKKFGTADRVFAYSLIFYNLYLCYLADFMFPYFYLALVFVLIGLYFFFVRRKDDYEWHISSVVVTIFCLFALVAWLCLIIIEGLIEYFLNEEISEFVYPFVWWFYGLFGTNLSHKSTSIYRFKIKHNGTRLLSHNLSKKSLDSF